MRRSYYTAFPPRSFYPRRSLGLQALETRCLLAAEGSVVALDRSFDASPLVGDLTATVLWGDGNQSPATVTGTRESGPLQFRFDYSLDRSGLFADPQAQAALEHAGRMVLQHLTDDLDAISPGGKLEWLARFRHPSTGADSIDPNTLTATIPVANNLRLASNELIVFVGGRDLPGNQLGVAFRGSWAFPATGPITPQEQAQILAFRNTVQYRGETDAGQSTPTDFGPWGGSVSFDTSDRSWYFGRDLNQLPPGQSDFVTTAAHELLHILGFGSSPSWDALATLTAFSGTASRAAYAAIGGTGNVPLEHGDHWGDELEDQLGELTLMREAVASGTRQLPTPLDFAALVDIGWEFQAANVQVTADHVYADNGDYGTTILLQGSQFGELVETAELAIANVEPELVGPAPITIRAGASTPPLTWTISDPGYDNPLIDPPTEERFEYQLDWRDGSPVETGQATVTQSGAAGIPTLASITASHRYPSEGTYPVQLTVTDDDGGTRSTTFDVTVLPAEAELAVSFDRDTYAESEGTDAVEMLVVRQSTGPENLDAPLQLMISGGDGRVTYDAQPTIPAEAESIRIRMTPVQDSLQQPMAELVFQVEAAGHTPGNASFWLLDDENAFQNDGSRFNVSGDVDDDGRPIVSAVDALQIINALNRFDGELDLAGRPFSTSDRWWDVNGDYRVSALDALQVINWLNQNDIRNTPAAAGEYDDSWSDFPVREAYQWGRENASVQDAALLSLLSDTALF